MITAYAICILASICAGALIDTMVAGRPIRGAIIGAIVGVFTLWLGFAYHG